MALDYKRFHLRFKSIADIGGNVRRSANSVSMKKIDRYLRLPAYRLDLDSLRESLRNIDARVKLKRRRLCDGKSTCEINVYRNADYNILILHRILL